MLRFHFQRSCPCFNEVPYIHYNMADQSRFIVVIARRFRNSVMLEEPRRVHACVYELYLRLLTIMAGWKDISLPYVSAALTTRDVIGGRVLCYTCHSVLTRSRMSSILDLRFFIINHIWYFIDEERWSLLYPQLCVGICLLVEHFVRNCPSIHGLSQRTGRKYPKNIDLHLSKTCNIYYKLQYYWLHIILKSIY